MKNIINYFKALFAVAVVAITFTACSDDDLGPNSQKLGIKTFFPTKVVTNQPLTINGTGLAGVQEIEFPGGAKVTDFEIVSEDMIRVNTPSGIPEEGGKIIVRSATDVAESPVSLTLGHTLVSGFSKQPGETATGGELITIYGTDLEFINGVELLDADGVPQLIDQKDFYRKGTGTVIFRVPKTNIFKGTFVGTIHTYDGKRFEMPELAYEPSADEGHWEKVRTTIWKNNGEKGVIDWGNVNCRFAMDGRDGNNECVATFPEEVWEKMKSSTFYVLLEGESPQIRVTTGWWSVNLTADDIMPGSELLTDNGDGTWILTVDLTANPELLGLLDEQHLLFTGGGYTIKEIYFEEDVWIEGGGHMEIVKTTFWKNNGERGVIDWGNVNCRFGLDGNDGNNECVATFPEDVWEKIKTGTFYMLFKPEGDWYQIRITNGWWDSQWQGSDNDFSPNNMTDRIIDNGDGTYYIEINFGDDPFVGTLDEKHLLFTGSGYTLLELYFQEEVWVGGGGEPKESVFWENNGAKGVIDWGNVNCRFALDGRDGNNECVATFPEEVWEKIKTGTFYALVEGENPQIRVTTGWWTTNLTADDIMPGNELLVDNGDGTWTLTLDLTANSELLGYLDEQHLLFTGGGYTLQKLYFLE